MTLYRNKYRIESARLPGWNYAAAGYYFITINTHERAHLFGKVVRGEMICNPLGLVVWEEWEKLRAVHGADMENRLIQRLVKELELNGTLEVKEVRTGGQVFRKESLIFPR